MSVGRPLLRRLASAASAVGVVTVGAVTVAPGEAEAASCGPGGGITVVIVSDEGRAVHCADGGPMTAMAATQEVATVVQVQTFPGAVCRIDGTPADQACVRMPPADAYWSMYHSDDGGAWVYSTTGAAGVNLDDGDAVAWAFSGHEPGEVPAPSSTPGNGAPSGGPSADAPVDDSTAVGADDAGDDRLGVALGGAAVATLSVAALFVARKRRDVGG